MKLFLDDSPIKYFFVQFYLKVRSEVFGDKWRITLTENLNLLLDVLDLILGLFQIDDLDGHDLLCSVVQALVDLAEGALADPLLLREHQLGVDPLEKKKRKTLSSYPEIFFTASKGVILG